MLEAVVTTVLPPSTGPKILLFKKFRKEWSCTDTSNFCTAQDDDAMPQEIQDFAEDMITFSTRQLQDFQPRDDYRELFKLTISFLGRRQASGTPISFKAPGGLQSKVDGQRNIFN